MLFILKCLPLFIFFYVYRWWRERAAVGAAAVLNPPPSPARRTTLVAARFKVSLKYAVTIALINRRSLSPAAPHFPAHRQSFFISSAQPLIIQVGIFFFYQNNVPIFLSRVFFPSLYETNLSFFVFFSLIDSIELTFADFIEPTGGFYWT